MDHLEYKDTTNKAFKTYYDKFKKMVKQDLEGDGWFLLVKDFPFKPEEKGQKFNLQLMFTAGENIGKWPDKNLVSLYGKTNYIIGRCRKKGPVLSLLDFQEGDYIKTATESGLRKELKEYFKGTGVSVRVYKSLKVTEPEPEGEEEEVIPTEETTSTESASVSTEFTPLEMPEIKPSSLNAFIKEIVARAESHGVEEEETFKGLVTNFTKAVPRAPVMKGALKKINDYFRDLPGKSTESAPAEAEEEEPIEMPAIEELTTANNINYYLDLYLHSLMNSESPGTMAGHFKTFWDLVQDTEFSHNKEAMAYLKGVKDYAKRASKFNLAVESAYVVLQKNHTTWNKALTELQDETDPEKAEELEDRVDELYNELEEVGYQLSDNIERFVTEGQELADMLF